MRNGMMVFVLVVIAGGSVLSAADPEPKPPVFKTDRGVYPDWPGPLPEPPKLPKAGGETFVDPDFGTTIMRVTDEADGDCKHRYSYLHTFNKDSTRFFINCGGKAVLYSFDPAAFRIKGKAPLFPANPPGGGKVRWDHTQWSADDPDLMYCHEGLRLYSYNVAEQKYTLLKDFTGIFGQGNLWQMSKSLDDKTFAFTVDKPDERVAVRFMVWSRDKDKILLNEKANVEFDEVQIDKTGRYLVIKTGQTGRDHVIRVRIADLETGKTSDLTDFEPDWAPGHSDNGHGTVVAVSSHDCDGLGSSLTLRKLEDPHNFIHILRWPKDWTQSFHISMLADDEDWALVSSYTTKPPLSKGLFHDEIFQVTTKGPGFVRRLAHHHSVRREFWDEPRANISRDGRFVTFTSNWGGSPRHDVFILRVPEEFVPKKK